MSLIKSSQKLSGKFCSTLSAAKDYSINLLISYQKAHNMAGNGNASASVHLRPCERALDEEEADLGTFEPITPHPIEDSLIAPNAGDHGSQSHLYDGISGGNNSRYFMGTYNDQRQCNRDRSGSPRKPRNFYTHIICAFLCFSLFIVLVIWAHRWRLARGKLCIGQGRGASRVAS